MTTGQALMQPAALDPSELALINAYWRAANYCSVGQIYLLDNPLLRTPLKPEHVKPRLLGHWGTTPGLNFIYAHMNRAIKRHDLNALFIAGPGHGGPGVVANGYLEGTYTELFETITQDERGLAKLFKQFSFPGGIPSHAAPQTPGSIHEGGELGYSLLHAFGAVADNKDLVAVCVIGDGEAETGPLATSWHANKFHNPSIDGMVLPILHLNGYKIANPTIYARMPRETLEQYLRGCGYDPVFVEGDDPTLMHQRMAEVLDRSVLALQAMSNAPQAARPAYPMIVLVSPKGWTGPKFVDGLKVEGTFRAHQVPLNEVRTNPEHLRMLEAWMKSYEPEHLFDADGRLIEELRALPPRGERRMSANPHANGGVLLKPLDLPKFADYACAVPSPGAVFAEATSVLGEFLRDVIDRNRSTFRLFGPDETVSNKLQKVFEKTSRLWREPIQPSDDFLAPEGRVLEILSEHCCQGWLEGYLLTGRHGLFNCYEAFIHIIDSMFNQHAKWVRTSQDIPWRKPIASLNYVLTSHVWRQDHNGFSHQDPGFLDHVMTKSPDVVRAYLPPDANTLLAVADHCLRSCDRINVIVAGKNDEPQWLDMPAAIAHVRRGVGVWDFASNDNGGEPDVVMACAGDVPTIETLAAIDFLRNRLPDLKIRAVNVVDLARLTHPSSHPHGLPDAEYEAIFTKTAPVIFCFHGYAALVHRLAYRRSNQENLHVHGFKNHGTTTTPFDMAVLNDIDRYHLAQDAIERLPKLAGKADPILAELRDRLAAHTAYIREVGEDMPEIKNWRWGAGRH